eukprot:COSAG06_NODE_19690_length_826_cov_1.811554_1_plen_105_part_00
MRFSLQGYACQTKNLVASYREQFSATPGTTAKDFPFGIVSLADGTSGDTRHTHTHAQDKRKADAIGDTHKTHTRQTKGRRETEPNVDCSFSLLLKDRFSADENR